MNLSHAQQQLVEKGGVTLGRLEMVTVAIIPFGAQAIHFLCTPQTGKQAGNPRIFSCRPSLMTTKSLQTLLDSSSS